VTPDPTLAALSDTLFSVAVGLYSLALVAFCAQLAFGRRPARQLVAAGGPPLPAADQATRGTHTADAAAETERGRRWGVVAVVLTALGAVAHAGVLVTRGMATDRLPWGNMYEFATAAVLVGVVAYLAFAVRTPALRHIGLFVIGPAVLGLVAIGLFLYAEAGPLVAALRSSWLAVHVTSASTLGALWGTALGRPAVPA